LLFPSLPYRRVGSVPDDPRAVLSGLFEILLLVVVIVGASLGHALVVAVGALTFAVTITARLWARLSLRDVTYTVAPVTTRAFMGDVIELVITLENRKPRPVPWLRVSEIVPEGLELLEDSSYKAYMAGSELALVVGLGRYERLKLKRTVRALERGHYVIGPATLESGDLFGLHRSVAQSAGPEWSLSVYPRTVPMPGFKLPSARPGGDVLARRKINEDQTRPTGLREYFPGDSIRTIDWKATARRGELQVRTYDPSMSHYAVVMLETATSTSPWEGYRGDVLEASITGAASIALRGMELGYNVGLITNATTSDDGHSFVRPGRTPAHMPAILEALARVRPVTVHSLESVARQHLSSSVPYGATLVVVCGIVKQGVAEFLLEMKRRGHPVLVMWTGRDDPPAVQGIEVRDARVVFGTAAEAPQDQFKRPRAAARSEVAPDA